MTEKGIVLRVHQGIAEVQLQPAPGVPKDAPQLSLQAKCSLNIAAGTPVLVRLSSTRPIHAKPWSLIIAVLIFGTGLVIKRPLTGFLLALISSFIPFFKLSRRRTSYTPCVISTLEESHAGKNI
jgi:hypothetical protein